LGLWRRAPLWRWSLIAAVAGTVSFVALPPPSPPRPAATQVAPPAAPPVPPPSAAPATAGGLTRPDAALQRQAGLPPVPTNPNVGTVHRGEYAIFGRHVPLPAGEFEVAAYLTGQTGLWDTVAASLVQISNNRVTAMITIYTTQAGAKIGTGFRTLADCSRT